MVEVRHEALTRGTGIQGVEAVEDTLVLLLAETMIDATN